MPKFARFFVDSGNLIQDLLSEVAQTEVNVPLESLQSLCLLAYSHSKPTTNKNSHKSIQVNYTVNILPWPSLL